MVRVLLRLTLCGFLLGPLAAHAEPRIDFDATSFFHIPSLGITANFPIGTIPVRASPIAAKRWAISVSKADVRIPDQTLPSGETLVATVTEDAAGECSISGSSASCSLKLGLLLQAGAYPPRLLQLSFTTGAVSRKAGGWTASRTGTALNTRTGAFQLVAAGETPPESAIRASQPFYVVLSGTLKDSPFATR